MNGPGVIASYEPIDEARQVTCWAKYCTTPACWLVKLSIPVIGVPGLALCDKHMYEFDTETREFV